MAGQTPTARTLAALRKYGWSAQVVERWLPGMRRNRETGVLERTPYGTRKDLFGLGDILALDGKPGSLLIQACAGASGAARAAKVRDTAELRAWLTAGNRFEVWAWREVWVDTSAKHRAKRWRPRIVALELDGEQVREAEVPPPLAPPSVAVALAGGEGVE